MTALYVIVGIGIVAIGILGRSLQQWLLEADEDYINLKENM